MSEGDSSRLAVLVDGTALEDERAKALWKEFSEHMDTHRSDLQGFAQKKGWASVLPEFRAGKAVLLVWTTEDKALTAKAQAQKVQGKGPQGKRPQGKGPQGKGPQGKKVLAQGGPFAGGGKHKPPKKR